MALAIPNGPLELGSAVAGLALVWGADLALAWLLVHPWVSLVLLAAAALLFLARLAAQRLLDPGVT